MKTEIICPECKIPMTYISEDMSGQGGPPEETFLCKKCGFGVPEGWIPNGEKCEASAGVDYSNHAPVIKMCRKPATHLLDKSFVCLACLSKLIQDPSYKWMTIKSLRG